MSRDGLLSAPDQEGGFLSECWTINQYDYQVKYLDIDTNTAVATSVTGKADYNTTVTGTQKTIPNAYEN